MDDPVITMLQKVVEDLKKMSRNQFARAWKNAGNPEFKYFSKVKSLKWSRRRNKRLTEEERSELYNKRFERLPDDWGTVKNDPERCY